MTNLKRYGLGDTADVNAAATTANALTKIVKIGSGPSGGITQTDTGKVAQDVRTGVVITGTVASLVSEEALVALAIPPPAGETVAAVLVIVGLAAQLIDSIFGSDPDKAKLAAARQIDSAAAITRSQIIATDQQIVNVTDGLKKLEAALEAQGLAAFSTISNAINNALSGLGSAADDQLYDAQVSYNTLNAQLKQKTDTLQSLIGNFNTTVTQVANAINGKTSGEKYILWGMGILVAIGFGYLGLRKIEHKKI